MKKPLIFLLFALMVFTSFSQTTSQDGSWQDNGNWSTTYPGSGTDADGTLNLDGETLNFNDYITLGTDLSNVNIDVASSNFAGEFIVNDTLVIFGNVSFQNKAMELTVTSNGVLIIFGDLSMNNKISVASDGVIVATGTFAMSGSTGNNDYSGAGNVYAGSYAGNAESEIDASGDGAGDSSFLIEDLSTDGFETIEDFVGGGGSTPLPVTLMYFQFENTDGVKLSWATASEINNHYFSVERSEDGTHFYEIATLQGNGNTNSVHTYSYTDRFAFSSTEYYRLKQVDFNGEFEYFQIVQVNTGLQKEKREIRAYPTKIRDGIMNVTSTKPFQIKSITLYNLSGGELKSFLEKTIQENSLSYRADLTGLEKGIYLLQVSSSEGDKLVSRIIIE
ncbi:MAG: T9SS type A sorting domain-containing protein [Ekhidna sp.]